MIGPQALAAAPLDVGAQAPRNATLGEGGVLESSLWPEYDRVHRRNRWPFISGIVLTRVESGNSNLDLVARIVGIVPREAVERRRS
jgi:hypothetical protein